jgi:hypothetical protein
LGFDFHARTLVTSKPTLLQIVPYAHARMSFITVPPDQTVAYNSILPMNIGRSLFFLPVQGILNARLVHQEFIIP